MINYDYISALAAARRRMQTAITEMSREDGRHVYDNPIMDSPPAYGIAVNSQYPEAPPPSYECSIPQTTPGTPQVYPPEVRPVVPLYICGYQVGSAWLSELIFCRDWTRVVYKFYIFSQNYGKLGSKIKINLQISEKVESKFEMPKQ